MQVDSGPSCPQQKPQVSSISWDTPSTSQAIYMYIDRCGEKENPLVKKETPLGEKKTPLGQKETPPGEKVTIFINAFLALAGLISERGGCWRLWTIAEGQAGTTGATWLGRGVGRGWVWAGAGRADGPGFGRGRGTSRTWRYVGMTGIWIRCRRFGVKQPDSKAIPKCQPNSEREKKNRSGLIPRALGPTKTSLNCLK